MIIVSKCLAGYACRYDGKSNTDNDVKAMVENGTAVCVCPECMGGMTTPRSPSEIVGGDGADVILGKARVLNSKGEDVTDYFLSGALKTLAKAQQVGAKHAVLKAKSPSCGCGMIYDGSFSGTLRQGNGVTAALLLSRGITVETR